MSLDFTELTTYSKKFSGLTPELESCLKEVAPDIIPLLPDITNAFYTHLQDIPDTADFLGGRIDTLKQSHLKWLEDLFSSDIDKSFAENMYRVGDIHCKVKLPVEFMAGAMTLINNELITVVNELYDSNVDKCTKVLRAISAVTGFTLMIMQQSYQESTLAAELEKFLKISGMSRTLFSNLATAYK